MHNADWYANVMLALYAGLGVVGVIAISFVIYGIIQIYRILSSKNDKYY